MTLQFLRQFANLQQGESGFIYEGGKQLFTTNFSFQYRINGIRGGGFFDVVDNVVVDLEIYGGTEAGLYYQIHQLLNAYGKPEDVYIDTYSSGPDGYLPFRLILNYPDQGLIAVYETEAKKYGSSTLKACLSEVKPWLILHPPEEKLTFEELAEWVLGPDPIPLPKPLFESTGMDLDSFYEDFRIKNQTCLKTPLDIWP